MMITTPLRCPNCREPLQATSANDGFACTQNHHFSFEEGILILLSDPFRQHLSAFLDKFEPLREADEKRILDPAVYESLPFTPALQANHGWRMRTYDIALITKLLAGRGQQRILDIGAWNGWLSHWLTKQGHGVTAVDYFTDPYDGLGSMRFYKERWQAIQMDLTDLSLLNGRFDVVILNRCVQFYADPVAYTLTAKERVAEGGLLIMTGLSFFADPRSKIEDIAAYQRHFREEGVPDFQPMKGYLDFEDKRRLEEHGIKLKLMSQLWRANLKSIIKKSEPSYFYGVWENGD